MDLMERKGALSLRSGCTRYSNTTLLLPSLQDREAEPKDYNINQVPLGSKNLCRSTYWRLGNMDEVWVTTYQDHLSQPFTNKEYKEMKICKSMLNEDNFEDSVIDRETGLPQTVMGAVLPRHSPDHFKMDLDTTYRIEYVPPYDYTPYVGVQPDGYSVVHRKCHSQFTDTADYGRHGINTWQNESGIYANAAIKQKFFPVTNPIPSNVLDS
ncbi:cilia- and flagella-associated protein 95 isoform X1 [Alligator mississippiensis]|uniref:cilia- and flagella-associated protein 95 isoform X1 n=1 Tax=Alligator mississippiensis TaxID=8496 RepID=UPI0007113876|nr:cilia- and flagella-associated protein 95 isoform X1 [Alligator mississippiensis]